jgi:hypothetical protein
MPTPLAAARAALALLALALPAAAEAEERRPAAGARGARTAAPVAPVATQATAAAERTPVLSPWAGVAPDLAEAHLGWSWVDEPIDRHPRRPGLVRHLTEEEERRLIRRDWR